MRAVPVIGLQELLGRLYAAFEDSMEDFSWHLHKHCVRDAESSLNRILAGAHQIGAIGEVLFAQVDPYEDTGDDEPRGHPEVSFIDYEDRPVFLFERQRTPAQKYVLAFKDAWAKTEPTSDAPKTAIEAFVLEQRKER
jgi:hypothetical protein